MKSYTLNFKGFIPEGLLSSFMPESSGIYIVHASSKIRAIFSDQRRLLYIGKANNLKDRVNPNHENYSEWKGALRENETLEFSYAAIDEDEEVLFRIESALIFENQPLVNGQSKKSFNYEDTIVYSNGTIGALKPLVFARRDSQKVS